MKNTVPIVEQWVPLVHTEIEPPTYVSAVVLRDALYNVHPDAGDNKYPYSRGVVVGVVSALVAVGFTYEQAIKILRATLPEVHRPGSIPPSWADDIAGQKK